MMRAPDVILAAAALARGPKAAMTAQRNDSVREPRIPSTRVLLPRRL